MTLTVSSPTRLVDKGGRIRHAALVCVGRFGLAKTTVDDIAREAGCSRATLYRSLKNRDNDPNNDLGDADLGVPGLAARGHGVHGERR